MKLYYKDDREKLIELDEVQCIGEGDVVIRVDMLLPKEKINEMENELRKKFRRRVIVLDTRYGEILVRPPKNKF